MFPFVIITHELPKDWLAPLENRVQMLVGPREPPGFAPILLEKLPEVGGILSLLTDRIDENILSQAGNLKVVSNMAVGVDNIDLQACQRHGVRVGNTPGVLTEGTADLTMALLLSIARRLPEASCDAREGRWSTWSPASWLGADLNEAVLGIVGLGKIGQAVAHRARGFGMRLIYTDSVRKPDLEDKLGIEFVSFDNLLLQSDFVTLHCPLLPETRGLINEASLSKMKSSSILINAARGPVVDSEALYRALKEGRIAAAALDVTDPEPLPPSHPLYTLKNCLIVPHIGSATVKTRKKMAELACLNLLAGIEGKPLIHQVV